MFGIIDFYQALDYLYAMPFDKNTITDKVKKGENLTDEEEKFYLMEVLGASEFEADRIITINNNKDPLVIID